MQIDQIILYFLYLKLTWIIYKMQNKTMIDWFRVLLEVGWIEENSCY